MKEGKVGGRGEGKKEEQERMNRWTKESKNGQMDGWIDG